MFRKNLILLAIFGSFYLLGDIHQSTASSFTVGKYVGKWYILGITVPDNPASYNMTSCVWYEVTKRFDSDTRFNEVHHLKIVNGRWIHDKGFGKVLDHSIHIIHPNWNTNVNIYDILSFNDEQVMVLHSKTEKLLNLLISRSPKISQRFRAEFGRFALKLEANIVYFPHDKCVYES